MVRKADNKEQATKEQSENKDILDRLKRKHGFKSEGEAKVEDEQYGKPNQQY